MRSESTNAELAAEIGYETKDVNIRQTLVGIVALLVFFAVAQIGILVLYAGIMPDWAKLGHPEPLPVNRRIPPYPQIQTDPHVDIERYRQAEEKELGGKDSAMSVDQAIDVMATQKGIAGVRGDAVHERATGFPGQTSAMGASAPAEKSETPAVPPASEAGHSAP